MRLSKRDRTQNWTSNIYVTYMQMLSPASWDKMCKFSKLQLFCLQCCQIQTRACHIIETRGDFWKFVGNLNCLASMVFAYPSQCMKQNKFANLLIAQLSTISLELSENVNSQHASSACLWRTRPTQMYICCCALWWAYANVWLTSYKSFFWSCWCSYYTGSMLLCIRQAAPTTGMLVLTLSSWYIYR